MPKLYELANSYKQLLEIIEDAMDNDASEDDIELLKETLESVNDSLEGKVENIVKFMKNIEGDIAAYKLEEKRLAQRRKYLENKYDWMKNYMGDMLRLAQIKEVNAGLFKVKFAKTAPSVEIVNENDVPEAYREKQPDKIKKKEILKDIKSGVSVPGVLYVDDKEHLRIT